jgi:hypothetical protein
MERAKKSRQTSKIGSKAFSLAGSPFKIQFLFRGNHTVIQFTISMSGKSRPPEDPAPIPRTVFPASVPGIPEETMPTVFNPTQPVQHGVPDFKAFAAANRWVGAPGGAVQNLPGLIFTGIRIWVPQVSPLRPGTLPASTDPGNL